jgi:NAD(P)H-hydrate epimerase
MVLMERAGISVFEVVRELLPDGGKLAILCGRGNNGGDGLVVARLAVEMNYHVDVLMATTEDELSAENRTQLAVTRAQGITPIFYDDARFQRRLDCLGGYDLIVDALLGTGAHGEVRGGIQDAIRAINRSGVPVVSVDVPSGIHTDTGEDLGESVWSLRTVTFGLAKPFLFQGIGLEHAGYWTVADIGYPSQLMHEPTEARLVSARWVADVLPERLRSAHKRDNGHVLIVAGSDLMPGAAVLACQGALRAGAGLVTLASTPAVCQVVASQIPEVIHLPLPDVDGAISIGGAKLIREYPIRFDSAVFGPGIGQSKAVKEFLEALWIDWDIPSVIDADALNWVSQGLALPDTECVLTPHPGEMSRLMEISIAEVQSDRFQTVKSAVTRLNHTIILKGPHTISGTPEQPMAVNTTGNNGMATAGMGDVLSGIIGTLLSQDLPTFLAATAGVYWHGLAADLCAEKIGPIGYLASDVVNALPAARAKLTTPCESRPRARSLPFSCQA